jgi:glutaredoxin
MMDERMLYVKVPGENTKHQVLMYTISTCIWCKKAKQFMKDHNIEHTYVDVDLCEKDDREKIRQDILSRGGKLVYPVIIVDDQIIINRFHVKKIREALEI